eukprot:5898088-Prymnesium_polylepis.2
MAYGAPEGGTRALRGSAVPLCGSMKRNAGSTLVRKSGSVVAVMAEAEEVELLDWEEVLEVPKEVAVTEVHGPCASK